MGGSARWVGIGRRSSGRSLVAALAVGVAGAVTIEAGLAQTCTREDFAAVVDDTAEALRVLNQKNRPEFQDRLRRLREKNRWSHDQFIEAATPYVKDEKIEEFDIRSDEALGRVTSMGQKGQQAKTPDCKLLIELKGHMTSLLDIHSAKWRYMFEKIDAALAK